MEQKGPQKLKYTTLLGIKQSKDYHGFINNFVLVENLFKQFYLNCHTILDKQSKRNLPSLY